MSKKCPNRPAIARRLGKTDIRYWQKAVFFPKYPRAGLKRQVLDLCAKIQHRGRRETIPLGTSNKAAAAAKARDFHPIHTLRKEVESQICALHGIYAPSRALRHSDVAITGQHYLDRRQRTVAVLKQFLERATNVTPLPVTAEYLARNVPKC